MIALTLAWWSGLAFAQPADAPEEPEPPVVTISPGEVGKLFADVAQAAATGNRDEATQKLVAIVRDPAKAPAHGQAWVMLADAFAEYELDLAAVSAWGKALSLVPDTAAPRVEEILDLAESTGETRPVAAALGGNAAIPVDPSLRNRVAYTAARYHLGEGNYGPALGMLMMADSSQGKFEDIELLRGVVLAQQGRHSDAVAPLITAEAMGRKVGRNTRFVNRANLNIARAYYASGNYTQAILFYAKVERSSEVWPDAQFERAWAHFRGNDMNGTLAMLYTHESPFFADDYHNPEADLLRAYALFIMCKFPDATQEINQFQEKWERIRDDYMAVSMTPEEAFADTRAFVQGASHTLPVALLRRYKADDRMADALKAVAAADDELERAETVGGPQGELASELIRTLRDERIRMEGQRVLERVSAAAKELDGMLTDIEITRLDLLNLESEMYQRAAATGVLEYGDHVGQLRDLRKSRKGFRVWPWQGEYWADEVGWYVFSARPDCPDSMAVGEDG
ncbi:MAG: hypothetical protein KTR31_15685 [Myxococcales bacterium]|nr:hypothetical protein [Myxococcales bacterium]